MDSKTYFQACLIISASMKNYVQANKINLLTQVQIIEVIEFLVQMIKIIE